ncbi:hypothetical protein WJX73_002951 [Symbiochloris irregularis]|uniref:Uncharacterized protein n=1 Tax=Symbiochloris irregularis TaxID=706552 RepID=A0AAW1NXP2_9CHLO
MSCSDTPLPCLPSLLLPIQFKPTTSPSGAKPGGSGLSERSLQEQAAARQVIERTWKIVSEMLDQMRVDMALAESYRNGSGESPSELRLMQLEAEATRKIVADRINRLDEGFLGGLEAYSTALRRSNQEDLADRLDAIRIEVLDQLTDRLPPEVRVLNTVTQLMDRNDRRGIIKEAAKGGYGKLPKVELPGLWLAANQVISDMEEAEALPDRRLLAMVCVVREEVQFVARELRQANGEFAAALKAQRNMLPQAALAFLQRLLQVSDPLQRQALLAKGFREDAKGKGARPACGGIKETEAQTGRQGV